MSSNTPPEILNTESLIRISYKDWEADILPSFGANVIKLTHANDSILHSPASLQDLTEHPYIYGIPILFPANRTQDGCFMFGGKTWQLPINEPDKNNHLHGLVWNAPFTVTKKDVNTVQCVLHNEGEYYPFPCSLFVTCSLDEHGFSHEVSITNTGSGPMPVLLAYHTTFNAPDTFQVPIGYRWDRDERLIPTGRLLELNETEKSIAQGTASCRQPIVGYFTSTGHRAVLGSYYYEASDAFTQWVIYTADGQQGYVCVEPQTGPTNGLNLPGGHLVIESGKTCVFRTSIYPR